MRTSMYLLGSLVLFRGSGSFSVNRAATEISAEMIRMKKIIPGSELT